jgi:predicted dehydrogenase
MLFNKLEKALGKVTCDAALIVVPPNIHEEVAVRAIQNGLHCIVEKPISDTIQGAKTMVAAAERAGVKLMVSQNYRYRRAPQTVKKLVKSGVIGEIGSVFINFQKAPLFSGFRTEMDEPLLVDMSVHHFDQIRCLLDLEPVRVTAQSWNPKWSWFKGNPTAVVIFETRTGATVVYTGSWVSRGWQTTWDGDWHIQGREGEIHWADNTVEVLPCTITPYFPGAREMQGAMVFDLVELKSEDRWASLAEFTDSITADREPLPSGRDNIKTLAMVLGALEACRTKKPVDLSKLT